MKTYDYIKWNELKKVCKLYKNKFQNKKPSELYQIMINNEINIPFTPLKI